MKQFYDDVDAAYSCYTADPHCITQLRRYLFNKPSESIESLDRDSLKCWCLSVAEAEFSTEQQAELHHKQKWNTLHHYFQSTDATILQYTTDPHCITQSRRYLFNKPSESIKSLDRDSLKCWCLSIMEAELSTEQWAKLHHKQKRNMLHHYFQSTTSKTNNSARASTMEDVFRPPFSEDYCRTPIITPSTASAPIRLQPPVTGKGKITKDYHQGTIIQGGNSNSDYTFIKPAGHQDKTDDNHGSAASISRKD